VSQESSNCGYPIQDVQTGLTKKRKRKRKRKSKRKRRKESERNCSVAMWAVFAY
jgi:hypothetical protein